MMKIGTAFRRCGKCFWAFLFICPVTAGAQSGIQRVSASLVSRQIENGNSTSLKGAIYYTANGNMVSHFTFPKEYMVITNNKGETRIYDPAKNTVFQFQNFLFSSSSTPFFYFFSGKTGDMGLLHAGYRLIDTKFDHNLVITVWQNTSSNDKDGIATVKLVHDKNRPIYMDYKNSTGDIIRKVYYYNYISLNGVEFPETFTEIVYQGKDSILSKTAYSEVKINNLANSKFFGFRIPQNAKLEK